VVKAVRLNGKIQNRESLYLKLQKAAERRGFNSLECPHRPSTAIGKFLGQPTAIELPAAKRNPYNLKRMTRGETGERLHATQPSAEVVDGVNNSRVRLPVVNTLHRRCVATTSNELPNRLSEAGQICHRIVAVFAMPGTQPTQSVLVKKAPCFPCFSAQRHASTLPAFMGAVSATLFFYLTPIQVSDHHPALLKMFDRTQAANTLS
jgi:hypothetical protein